MDNQMSGEEWIVKSEDGKQREVESRQEAQKAKDDLEDLGLEVSIIPPESSEANDDDSDSSRQGRSPNETNDEESILPIYLDQTLRMYEEYEDLKGELIQEDDIQEIDGDRQFIRKSGWRKIATAFHLNLEVIDYKRSEQDGVIRYTVRARAEAPNKKSASAVAVSESTEPKFTEIVKWVNQAEAAQREEFDDDPNIVRIDGAYRRIKPPREVNEHDLITLAATRAKNRAISDLIGGGEASAEEIRK